MLGAKQKEQVQGLGMYPYIEAPYHGAPSVWTTDISSVRAKLNVNECLGSEVILLHWLSLEISL